MGKKYTFVIEEFNASGGLKILTAIINLLADNDIEIKILVQKSLFGPFYPLNNKIEVEYIGLENKNSKFIYFIYLFFKLFTVKQNIIVINFRLAVLSFVVRTMKFDYRPMFFLIQGLDNISIISNKNFFIRNINRLLYFLSKKIPANRIFVSNYLASKYEEKGVVIPNYVNEVFFNDNKLLLSKNKICIGTVSTSSPNKGFDFFLACSHQIKKELVLKGYDLKFICATQDKNLYESKPPDEIEFVFPKNEFEMSSFYSSCNVLLSCSISEGFNLPVLEAMASGCIVMATHDGAVNDLITNGKNGYIFNKRDASLISKKLLKLLDDKNLLNEISREAKLTATMYSKGFFDKSYLEYFNKNYTNNKEKNE